MTKARDVMHIGAKCIGENGTLSRAAEMMRDLHVGALPVCGEDGRLHGIITDRDIVVRAIAEGYDPDTATAGDLAEGTPIWVDADAATDEVLDLMIESGIRRIPVIEDHQLIGMISEADLAQHLPVGELKRFTDAVYSAPPNS
ncbi:MAG TPA: CBS domain-containing protein [Micromonosporaceae bacterium]|jgi:CBS domain-containing protein